MQALDSFKAAKDPQKLVLGEKLHAQIVQMQPAIAGKITGMPPEDSRNDPASIDVSIPPFEPATEFSGAEPGAVFKLGDQGLGYYHDYECLRSGSPALSEAERHCIATSTVHTMHLLMRDRGGSRGFGCTERSGGSCPR